MSRSAVYTIIRRSTAEQAALQGGWGELVERKRWATASRMWQACRDAGEAYLLLLGDAAEIRGVEWVAQVESIEVYDDGRTLVMFSGLRALAAPLPRRSLHKASDGEALSNDYIRPYVPYLLRGRALETVQRALQQPLEPEVTEASPGVTERAVQAAARIGQGAFRMALMQRWQGRCAVTGCEVTAVLMASHIKPWRDATDTERLDPFNGLLLAAQVDRLFDAGLISFTDDGRMLQHASVSKEELRLLGLSADARLRHVDEHHRPYLMAHRAAHDYPDAIAGKPGGRRQSFSQEHDDEPAGEMPPAPVTASPTR